MNWNVRSCGEIELELQNMIQYEEKFGVKVDVRIPDEDKQYLYTQWEQWREGIKEFKEMRGNFLLTRYEHVIISSGVGFPPDPFKPLCLQHHDADLKRVIEERRRVYPPGSLHRNSIYTFGLQHQELLEGKYISTEVEIPDINEQGRIPPPRIVAFYNGDDAMLKRKIPEIAFEDSLKAKLQFMTSCDDLKLKSGTRLREVFDFENGYRIELADLVK